MESALNRPTDWIPHYLRQNIRLEHILRKSHFCVELSNTFKHKLKVQHLITHTKNQKIITKIFPCKDMLN